MDKKKLLRTVLGIVGTILPPLIEIILETIREEKTDQKETEDKD